MKTSLCLVLAIFCFACSDDTNDADADADTNADESETDTGGSEQCADIATQEACESTQADDDWACAWVDVRTLSDACGELSATPTCLPLTYQGAGCSGVGCDLSPTSPKLFHRDNDGEAELFVLDTCEYWPQGWTVCDFGMADLPDVCTCGC